MAGSVPPFEDLMAFKLPDRPAAGLFAALLVALAPPAFAQPRTAPSTTPTAERPVLLVDQIRSPPIPRELGPLLQPLNTLEQVEALLRSRGIAFKRERALIDTRTVNRELVKILAALPPGELFIVPERGEMTYNRVLAALTPQAAAAQMAPPPPPKAAPKRKSL